MHLSDNQDLHVVLVDHSLKIKNKKSKETRDSRYIYQNDLDKACFQHHMAYGDFKDLNSRTVTDILHDEAFNVAKNLKYHGYEHEFA